MKIQGRRAVALVAGLLLVGPFSVMAHHSEAAYDHSKVVTIEGKVAEISWAVPHALFFVEAARQGESKVERWVVEGPYPQALESNGWTKDSIKVGEQITVMGNPARSGRPMMVVREVKTAGGEHFVVKAR